MPQFVRLAVKGEMPAPGEVKEFGCGEKVLCITNVEGTLTALDGVCLHRGGPLGQGLIEEGKLVCPWHGWQYDPRTGEVAHSPGVKVASYPLKIEGEDVLVEL